MASLSIVGAGLISVDNLFVVREKGTIGQLEGVSPEKNLPCKYIGSHGGGSTSNTLCILSKLGFESSVLGAVGNDTGAKLVTEEFQEFGVNTDLVLRKEGETRQFSHLIFPDHHMFSSKCPRCGNTFPRSLITSEVDVFSNDRILKRISEADILHIDRANTVTLKLVDSSYRKRKVISFDFGYQAALGSHERAMEIIKRATILKTTKSVASTFLSRIGKNTFYELNPNLLVCVVTKGDEGVELAYRSENGLKSLSMKPYKPSPVVDRGGAGDAFHAGLLFGLRNNLAERPNATPEEDVQRALELAQGFGALACTDYGSRGYFLGKLNGPDFESGVLNDFEALEKGAYKGSPPDPDILFSEKRNQLLSASVCGVCGKPLLKTDGSTIYEGKIDFSPWAMSASFQNALRSKDILSSPKNGRIYLVGSGASFSVARLGEILLNQFTDTAAVAMTPYDYVKLSRRESSAILISFGGRNSDIFSALERAKDIGSQEVHIITADGESDLARRASRMKAAAIHRIPSRVVDAGFVSTTGMLSCAATLLGILCTSFKLEKQDLVDFFALERLTTIFHDAKKDVSTRFDQVSEKLESLSRPHIVALGSGWAWPAVADLESRITEGAVCTIEVSELKNYTHGRYLNAYRNKDSRLFILFGLPGDDRLLRFLREKLAKDFPVIEISSNWEPPLGSVDLLIRELYASSELSKRRGMDIARAWGFPKESRGLFSWGPIYLSSPKKLDEFAGRSQAKNPKDELQAKLP